MGAQLKGTVFVADPDTHQTVELAPGTSPEPRLAALVTNPAAWVDGKLPRLPKAKTDDSGNPSGSDPGAASGGDSVASGTGSQPSDQAAPAAKKTAAKRAASSRSRGRDAADQGDSGA